MKPKMQLIATVNIVKNPNHSINYSAFSDLKNEKKSSSDVTNAIFTLIKSDKTM